MLDREHVREQITAMSEVVRALGAWMIPTQQLCDALADLGLVHDISPGDRRLIGKFDSAQTAYNRWTASLLMFDSKLVAADLVVTDPSIRKVLDSMKRRESEFTSIMHAQQNAIMADEQPGDIPAVRAAYGELAKLTSVVKTSIAQHLTGRLRNE